MNAYSVRTLSDTELSAMLQRLERQVHDSAHASTALGRKLHEQYAQVLSLCRLELERRACD